MSSSRGPMAPATYLLTDGIERYARRTGPLSIKETHKERDVTATCDMCERRQLRRYLVKKVTLGVVCCFDGCKSPDEYTAAELRTDTAIDALNLPHETLRVKMAKGAGAESRVLLAPPAPEPSAVVVHGCNTCRRDFTHEEWLKLELLQVKEVTEDGVVELHDMRNCTCGSTLLMISEREKGTGIYYRGGAR